MQQLAIYQFIWWLFLFFFQVCFVKQYKKTVRLVDIVTLLELMMMELPLQVKHKFKSYINPLYSMSECVCLCAH